VHQAAPQQDLGDAGGVPIGVRFLTPHDLGQLISFVISQNLDVRLFSHPFLEPWEEAVGRNNVATIISQFVDTTSSCSWRSGGTTNGTPPRSSFPGASLLGVQVVFALADTPFCYWGVRWLRKGASLSPES
jgi:uncharacterized PurR-regulated membrane protein YhhQ (DUF165 family)